MSCQIEGLSHLGQHKEVAALAGYHQDLQLTVPVVRVHVADRYTPRDEPVPRVILLQAPTLPGLQRHPALLHQPQASVSPVLHVPPVFCWKHPQGLPVSRGGARRVRPTASSWSPSWRSRWASSAAIDWGSCRSERQSSGNNQSFAPVKVSFLCWRMRQLTIRVGYDWKIYSWGSVRRKRCVFAFTTGLQPTKNA